MKNQINSLYCNTVSFIERVSADEAGEAHMVSVVGVAAAVGLAVVALKPLVQQAGEVFGNGVLNAVSTAAGG